MCLRSGPRADKGERKLRYNKKGAIYLADRGKKHKTKARRTGAKTKLETKLETAKTNYENYDIRT